MLRVGLVGFGLAGRVFHGPLLAADPRFSLRLVVTRDQERAAAALELHPGAEVVASTEVLLDRSDELDLVVVASPPATHVDIARRSLDAGLHVVVDKPLCPTADEGRALCEQAERLGLMLTVFQNRRWDSDFLTLRRLLEAGELGDVRRFESRFERWRPQETESLASG